MQLNGFVYLILIIFFDVVFFYGYSCDFICLMFVYVGIGVFLYRICNLKSLMIFC